MANFIKIDTKFAKRDIQRMNNAAQALEDAQKKYNEMKAYIESVYKGDGGKSLAHAVEIEGIRCKFLAEDLRTVSGNLQTTVNQYEDYSRKMVNSIKGK